MITQSDLQGRLTELCEQYSLPGAAFAVARGDETVVAWTGTAHLGTGLPVRRDTLFAAGSVTKVFTVSLVMALVDEGLVDLDAPVVSYVPELKAFRDPRAVDITGRMLLNHTSGLPGNVTFDLPRGPQCVARFVERVGTYELNSPPGQYWSYSNGGLVVAGRVAEVVTGLSFNDALADRILRPLALNATSETEEMVLRSLAIGHVPDGSGANQVAPRFQLGTNAPSGSALFSDIDGIVEFARMHLRGGIAADGTRVLSGSSVVAMQTRSADLPWAMGFDDMGLGWLRRQTAAGLLVAHTGASAGQHSMLNVLPERDGALAALTNGVAGPAVYTTLANELLQDLFGVTPAAPPSPAEPLDVDLDPLVGLYTADEGQVVVDLHEGRLRASHVVDEDFGDVMRLIVGPFGFPPPPTQLSPYAADGRFLADTGQPVQFVTLPGDEMPSYLYVGRIYRRVS